jgi:hypothetical protein
MSAEAYPAAPRRIFGKEHAAFRDSRRDVA